MLYLLRNSEEKTISQVKFFVLRRSGLRQMSAIRTSGRQSRSCPETGFGEVSDRSAGRFVGNAEVGFRLAGCRARREQFNRSVSQAKFRLLQIMRSCHSL